MKLLINPSEPLTDSFSSLDSSPQLTSALELAADPKGMETEEARGRDVPGEILRKILLRLPVKSLIRFRCVCKSWKSLLASPDFVSAHLDLNRNEPPSRLLLMHYSLDRKKTRYTLYADRDRALMEQQELDFPFNSDDTYHYVGSCAGLICFSDYLVNYLRIVLWNPSTRSYLRVPIPRFLDSDLSFYDVLGFGFDEKHGEYKVLRLIHVCSQDLAVEGRPEAEIYEVKTNSWRQIRATAPCVEPYSSSQTFLNGFIHWLGLKDVDEAVCCAKIVVMSFDVHQETFAEIYPPSRTAARNAYNLTLVVNRDSLCLIEKDLVSGFNIWIMNEYGVASSWTKLFAIDFAGDQVGFERVLSFRTNGEVLLVTADDELASYDPESGEIIRLGLHGVPGTFEAVSYMECLSLIGT